MTPEQEETVRHIIDVQACPEWASEWDALVALLAAYDAQAARLAAAAAVLERFAGTRVPTAADFEAAEDWLDDVG